MNVDIDGPVTSINFPRTRSESSGMPEAPDNRLTSTQQRVQNLGEPLLRAEQPNRQAEDPEIQEEE